MWVTQEVILGEDHKENAVVVCGGKRKDFTAFVKGVQILMENTITMRVPTSFIVDFRIWQSICPPNGGLKISTNASLLIRYRNRLCSDPRDKIYALLRLVRYGGLDMRPDYNKELDRVFHNVFKIIVKETRELSSAVRTPQAPDWSIPLEEQIFVPPRNVCSYSAATGMPAAVRFSADTLVMSAKGVPLG